MIVQAVTGGKQFRPFSWLAVRTSIQYALYFYRQFFLKTHSYILLVILFLPVFFA